MTRQDSTTSLASLASKATAFASEGKAWASETSDMSVKDRSGVKSFLRRTSSLGPGGVNPDVRQSRQTHLKNRAVRRQSPFGEVDQMYSDALEDLEVSAGAFIASNVTEVTGKKDNEGFSRSSDGASGSSVPPPFTALLNQLGDQHGCVVTQLAELKSECFLLRNRLETQTSLREREDSEKLTAVQRYPSDGALSASSPPSDPASPANKFLYGGPASPTSDGEDIRLLANRPASPTTQPILLNAYGSEQSTGESQLCTLKKSPAHPHSPTVAEEQDSMPLLLRPQSKETASRKFSEFQCHGRWTKNLGVLHRATIIDSPSAARGSIQGASSGQLSTTSSEFQANLGVTLRPGEHDYDGFLRNFIRYPTSPKQVSWDLLGAVLILYDLVAIPLRVFDPPDTLFTEMIDWFALIFWTLNMFASLTVGYLDDAKFVLNPMKILRQYMRFWLWIDLAVVAPDWIFTIATLAMNTQSDAGDSVKLLRILRLLRCMRLLRLAKLKWIIASIKDLINSESIDIAFNIAKMIVFLIACNHFLACAWYATTLIGFDNSWIKFHGYENEHWTYQYVTSFHWAITQFTPSSMHVQPQNIFERSFSVIVVIAGLVGFSYLVGSITGSLAELRRIKEDAVKQFWNLRRFLKKSQVPLPLRIRIEKYLEHAWQLQKDSVTCGNLPILKLLTEQLRNELNCAMSMPHLEVHPLFEYLCTTSTSAVAMQRIATKALSRKLLARGESNFHPGEIAQHMSFVVAGKLHYSKLGLGVIPDHNEFVDKGEDWIMEPAMWILEWTTLGELVAVGVSELLEVSSEGFADSIKRTPQVYERVCIYAANFIQYLNGQNREDLSDICQGDLIGEHIKMMLIDKEAEEHIYDVIHSPRPPHSWQLKKTRTFSKGWHPKP